MPEKPTYPLNIDGWKMNFLYGWPISRGEVVSFRESKLDVHLSSEIKLRIPKPYNFGTLESPLS